MSTSFYKSILVIFIGLLATKTNGQDFQGQAYYFSKTTMDMSRWGRNGQLSEQQKKQMMERMRPWLEKTYILTFNREESIYKEDERLEAPGMGGGFSAWGSSFSPGPQYKNVKNKEFIQDQEFFGKKFLIKEELKPLEWKMGKETKTIGQYTCFKATATRPSTDINWSRVTRRNRNNDQANNNETKKDSTATVSTETKEEEEIETVEIVAWYTPMIPVNQGPADYWGLPGLILELSAGNVTMLCSKIVMNPEEKIEIEAPSKGEVVTKAVYNQTIMDRMEQMRNSRGRSRGRRF